MRRIIKSAAVFAVALFVLSFPIQSYAATTLEYAQTTELSSEWYSNIVYKTDYFFASVLEGVSKDKTVTVEKGTQLVLTYGADQALQTTYSNTDFSAYGSGIYYYGDSTSYCITTDEVFSLSGSGITAEVSGFGSKTYSGYSGYGAGEDDTCVLTEFTVDTSQLEAGTYDLSLTFKYQMAKKSMQSYKVMCEYSGTVEDIVLTVTDSSDSSFDDCLETYNAAVASMITDFSPYTADSAQEYLTAADAAIADGNAAIEAEDADALDAATAALVSAKSLLVIRSCAVFAYVVGDDGGVNAVDASSEVSYGDTVTIDLSDYTDGLEIEKITVERGGKTTKISAQQTFELVVTDDVEITAYLGESTESKGCKVTMLNRNGKVIGIAYVESGFVIDSQSQTLLGTTAPDIAFYNFSGWEIVSGSETVTQDTVVRAQYTVAD